MSFYFELLQFGKHFLEHSKYWDFHARMEKKDVIIKSFSASLNFFIGTLIEKAKAGDMVTICFVNRDETNFFCFFLIFLWK